MNKILMSPLVLITILFFGHTGTTYAASKTATSSATSTATTTVDTRSVEERVREYFKDVPVMAEIARCESKFRQFADSGSVLRGGTGGGMIGVFQFYEAVHANTALGLGFDLATLDGNLGYARYVYEHSGTSPWNSGSDCWGGAAPVVKTVTTSAATKDQELQIVLLKKVISLLQQLLALQLAAQGR